MRAEGEREEGGDIGESDGGKVRAGATGGETEGARPEGEGLYRRGKRRDRGWVTEGSAKGMGHGWEKEVATGGNLNL